MRWIRILMGCALCAVIFTGVSTTNVEKAYGVDLPLYVGEYCWDTTAGGFLKIGITLEGDGHFSFAGTAAEGDLVWTINGNLEVVGGNVLITWTDAPTFDQGMSMISRVGNAVLDVHTLDGTSEYVGMLWEGGECTLEHGTDMLYSVSCDGSMSMEGADRREELKSILREHAR